MKKLLIILALFAVVMGGAVGELLYTTHFFGTTEVLLQELYDDMESHPDQLDNPETLRLLERVESYWQKGRNTVMMLGNHTILRNADERLVALGGYLRQNEYADASVMAQQALRYIGDLKTDNYPNLTNLF